MLKYLWISLTRLQSFVKKNFFVLEHVFHHYQPMWPFNQDHQILVICDLWFTHDIYDLSLPLALPGQLTHEPKNHMTSMWSESRSHRPAIHWKVCVAIANGKYTQVMGKKALLMLLLILLEPHFHLINNCILTQTSLANYALNPIIK